MVSLRVFRAKTASAPDVYIGADGSRCVKADQCWSDTTRDLCDRMGCMDTRSMMLVETVLHIDKHKWGEPHAVASFSVNAATVACRALNDGIDTLICTHVHLDDEAVCALHSHKDFLARFRELRMEVDPVTLWWGRAGRSLYKTHFAAVYKFQEVCIRRDVLPSLTYVSKNLDALPFSMLLESRLVKASSCDWQEWGTINDDLSDDVVQELHDSEEHTSFDSNFDKPAEVVAT